MRRPFGTFHHGFAALVNLGLLYLVNAWALWLPFTHGAVTASWPRLLWALNLAAAVQVAGNLALAIARPEGLRLFIEWLFAVCSLVLAIAVVAVFPFELSRVGGPWLELVARALALLGVGGASLGFIVRSALLILGPRPRPGAPAQPT